MEYRRLDAFELDQLDEPFDVIFCFGILHRVESPLGLLKVLRRRLAGRGYVLLETYGVANPELEHEAAMHVCEAGEVYARDDYVYWGFTGESLARLAGHAGFGGVEIVGHAGDRRPPTDRRHAGRRRVTRSHSRNTVGPGV